MKTTIHCLTLALTLTATATFAGDITPRHGGITGALGDAATATDIYKCTCGAQPFGVTYSRAGARVTDLVPVAKPIVNVRIAPWLSASSTCGTYSTAKKDSINTAANPKSGDGDVGANANPSPYAYTAAGSINIAAGNNMYCVKVNKTAGQQNNAALPTTAVGAENYSLDQHCEQNPTIPHNASTCTLIQNQ